MKKKGFTLTELLGIMVILAVIALIAVPLISGHMQTSREESAKRSADGILKAAINYYTNEFAENGSFELYDGLINDIARDLEVERTVTINEESGYIIIDPFGYVQVFYIAHKLCIRVNNDMDAPIINREDLNLCRNRVSVEPGELGD